MLHYSNAPVFQHSNTHGFGFQVSGFDIRISDFASWIPSAIKTVEKILEI